MPGSRPITLALAAAFAVFSVLALSGVVPRGPTGDWPTPLWADLVLAPFSSAAMVLVALTLPVALHRGWISAEAASVGGRIVVALLVATAIEVVIKGGFPSSSGRLGPVAVGPFEFGFYPSGHTLRSTVIAIWVAAILSARTPLAWLALATGPIVGTMLVAAGGHYPVDVVGGLLLGGAAGVWAVGPMLAGRTGRERAGAGLPVGSGEAG